MENMSDSLMPRPLLLCLKSEKIVCYNVPDNNQRLLLNKRWTPLQILHFFYKKDILFET